MKNKHKKCVGPILLSALSLFLSFIILQPLALLLGPEFNLLASRGIGKVVFVSMAIYQILLLLSTQHKNFLSRFFETNLLFLIKDKWLVKFLSLFSIFFCLHAFVLLALYSLGYIVYNPGWGDITLMLLGKTLFGLFVVFMLAWTEELIFRGTIFPYFSQYYKPVTSMLVTSFIFMLVHNLTNPLALVTTEWQLGLGLFLLGLLLNQTFFLTKKLYTGMGIHAGLVFVKVVLRRAPFLQFIEQSAWHWSIHKDLRQSHVVHLLFIITILLIFAKNKKKFFGA